VEKTWKLQIWLLCFLLSIKYEKETEIKKEGRMMIEISIIQDSEASVFIAVCDEIGLALEDKSYTTLLKRVKEAVPEMARDNNIDCSAIKIVDKTNIIKERACLL
jgi:hypothetical protein